MLMYEKSFVPTVDAFLMAWKTCAIVIPLFENPGQLLTMTTWYFGATPRNAGSP